MEQHRKGGGKFDRAKTTGSLLENSLSRKWLYKEDQNNGNINKNVTVEGRKFQRILPLNNELRATNYWWNEN